MYEKNLFFMLQDFKKKIAEIGIFTSFSAMGGENCYSVHPCGFYHRRWSMTSLISHIVNRSIICADRSTEGDAN